MLSCQTAQSCD